MTAYYSIKLGGVMKKHERNVQLASLIKVIPAQDADAMFENLLTGTLAEVLYYCQSKGVAPDNAFEVLNKLVLTNGFSA